jgi:cell division septal protein FtsQ
MAVNLNPVFKYQSEHFQAQSLHFRRKDKKTKTKKINGKIKLGYKNIIFSFLFISILFVAFQQVYLFLISWEKLSIDRIVVSCSNPQVQADSQQFLKGKILGNILLLNIDRLRQALESHRRVKEVRIRRIFPATLKIKIEERVPAAVIKKQSAFLVDRQGVQLDPVVLRANSSIPLFIDAGNFQLHAQEKQDLAWKCMDSLTPAQKDKIDILDLSDYNNIKVKLKNSLTWLKLGENRFSEKIQTYQTERSYLKLYEPLEYVDLRIPGRLIIKPSPRKEAK